VRDHGEVYDVNVQNMALTKTITVNKVTIPDVIKNSSGVLNFYPVF